MGDSNDGTLIINSYGTTYYNLTNIACKYSTGSPGYGSRAGRGITTRWNFCIFERRKTILISRVQITRNSWKAYNKEQVICANSCHSNYRNLTKVYFNFDNSEKEIHATSRMCNLWKVPDYYSLHYEIIGINLHGANNMYLWK